MPNSYSIEALVTKREQLVSERDSMLEQFNNEIREMESSIELLSGKKVWEVLSETSFDDTHPSYIKSSQEEI